MKEQCKYFPFKEKVTGFHSKSQDSVVATLETNPVPLVVKWNREKFKRQHIESVAVFLQKSIELYKLALGEEFLIPTQIVIGAKQDGSSMKPKVYQVQPFIYHTTTLCAPQELIESEIVKSQWGILEPRLSRLYQIARNVKPLMQPESVFPVNISTGSARKQALCNGNTSQGTSVPRSQNILLEQGSNRLLLCDFGKYQPWRPEMQLGYDTIKKHLS